jgi:thiol-disulfide isomerase/thioredoxin
MFKRFFALTCVRCFLFAACVFVLASRSVAFAETLRTLKGETVEGQLNGLYGDLLVVGVKGGSFALDVNSLDDPSLLKVAKFIAQPVAAPAPWNQSSSKVAKGVAKKLQVLKDGRLVAFDPGARPEPEFYLVYFGAYWCGPCRRFSPRLVESYHRMKTVAPDRFEVIFISDDTDSGEQLRYAREVNMPWPVVKYSATNAIPVFEQWRARGIPCLVVLNREGDLIYHSYRKDEYLGADDPLEKFSTLLDLLTRKNATPPANRHRLALAEHLQAAAGGDRAIKPYRIVIDRNRLRTLSVPEVTARLTIDATGHVTDAEFTPQLDAVPKEQLMRETENWLFLPRIVAGQPQQAVVQLPINFRS